MAEWTTGAAILAQAGISAPGSADEQAWAETCAAAVNAGLDARLEGAVYIAPPLPPELTRAALTAGVVAYKQRESDQSSPARVVDDYLDTIAGILERYATRGIA